ncbi:MAG: hypothetical protein QOE66_2331 [Chloroflexota bacterium]|nr:hypothetical protein [Chloroflexota bacterium]
MRSTVDAIEEHASVMEGTAHLDELGFPQEPQLAAHGGSAESELSGQA